MRWKQIEAYGGAYVAGSCQINDLHALSATQSASQAWGETVAERLKIETFADQTIAAWEGRPGGLGKGKQA